MSPIRGLSVPSKYIPEDDSLVRYVPWTRLRKDGDDGDLVIGILPQAFELRPAEEYLSATWLEFFAGDRPTRLIVAVNAIRGSDIQVKSKSGFAIGQVVRIRGGCDGYGCSIRVIHEESPDNAAHTAVRRWPRDNADLFQLMADELWNELVLNKDVP